MLSGTLFSSLPVLTRITSIRLMLCFSTYMSCSSLHQNKNIVVSKPRLFSLSNKLEYQGHEMRRDLLRRRLRAIQKSIGASSFVRCSPVSLVLHSVTVEYTHTHAHISSTMSTMSTMSFFLTRAQMDARSSFLGTA